METKILFAKTRTIVQTKDGKVLFPQSHFLNFGSGAGAPKIDTQTTYHSCLKCFERFLTLERISIEQNILNLGTYLDAHQTLRLKYWLGFSFQFMLSCKKIPTKFMNSYAMEQEWKKIHLVGKNGQPCVGSNYVALSTYNLRISTITSYLEHHFRYFGREMVNNDRAGNLRRGLEETLKVLRDSVSSGRPHESQITSFPQERWHQILSLIALHPEKTFLTNKGDPCRNLKKHQLIAFLCAEGLRRGAVANLRIQDHRDDGMLQIRPNSVYWDKINDGRRKPGTASLKQRDADFRRPGEGWYFKINPHTNFVFREYLKERKRTIDKFGADRSQGFLFLKEDSGLPLTHRQHIDETFKALKRGLSAQGLLQIDGSDPFAKEGINHYECRPHVFRHSGVCEMALRWFNTNSKMATIIHRLEEANTPQDIIDDLRQETNTDLKKDITGLEEFLRDIYNWSPTSEMPKLYAKRVETMFARGVRSDYLDLVIEMKNKLLGDVRA